MEEKKVLLVKLSSLGDVIFNIPLASCLKKAGYKVSWLVGEKGYAVVQNNPAVDEVIPAPGVKYKKESAIKKFIEYVKLIKYIRSQHFDIAIDSQMLFKSFKYTVFSGAKRRIVSKTGREFSFLGGNEWIDTIHKDYNSHAVLNYLKFADYLGIDTDKIEVTLPSTPNDSIEKIDKMMTAIDTTKPLVVICPATTWITKHWNKDNWKNLIDKFGEDYNLIFTGGKGDKGLIEYITQGKFLNLAGETSLEDLVEIFRRADLVISLDSGSTHLAWATQKPKIVSIFCSTPSGLYAPFGNKDKYIALSSNLPCQPCHKRVCPNKKEKNKCTYYPSVQEVYDAVKTLLN